MGRRGAQRKKLVQGNGDICTAVYRAGCIQDDIQMRGLAIRIIDFIPDLVWQYALHTIVYEYAALQPLGKMDGPKVWRFRGSYLYIYKCTAYE